MSISFETLQAFSDELEKIAGPALWGAGLGAGLAGAQGGLKEWDRRIIEDRHDIPPERKKQMRQQRLARLATGIAGGAVAGGIAGHYGGKAFNAAVDNLGIKGRQVLHESIEQLGSHYEKPFKGENARALGENLKEGFFPHPLRRMRSWIPFGKKKAK